jgi:hypothetical protein
VEDGETLRSVKGIIPESAEKLRYCVLSGTHEVSITDGVSILQISPLGLMPPDDILSFAPAKTTKGTKGIREH